MEYFLDKEKHLDQPVFAHLPVAEIPLELQLPRFIIDKGMEHLGLEVYDWHDLRVISREGYSELESGVLVDTLLHKVDALPVSELWTWVVR